MIIAAYRAADFIAEAVASALDQTVPPREVIVCDDGSEDEIGAALAPFGERVTLLLERHGGDGAARNAAARVASGDFVAVLDHDDRFMPERLEALGELAAARPDLDILATDAYIELRGSILRTAYDRTWTFEVADQRSEILRRNFIVPHPAIRRQRLAEIGGFDESITYSDWDCWLRLTLSGSPAGVVDQPLYRYRLGEGAQSSDPARKARGRAETLEKAAREATLSDAERDALIDSLEGLRRSASLEEARQALATGATDARRRMLKIARRPGYDPSTRTKAALSALVPPLGRALLLARARRNWTGAAGIRVDRR